MRVCSMSRALDSGCRNAGRNTSRRSARLYLFQSKCMSCMSDLRGYVHWYLRSTSSSFGISLPASWTKSEKNKLYRSLTICRLQLQKTMLKTKVVVLHPVIGVCHICLSLIHISEPTRQAEISYA